MTLDEIGSEQLLKALTFLHPNEVSEPVSAQSFFYFARKLPITTQKDMLVDEFKLVQLSSLLLDQGRIDKWNNVIQGGKHPNSCEVVRNALTISHGSASIEWDFSPPGRVLSKERSSMSNEL